VSSFSEHLINVVFLPTLHMLLWVAITVVLTFGRGLIFRCSLSPGLSSGIIL